MKTIDLREYPYPALIWPCPSGIVIEQQVAGLSCKQRKIEGILLPHPHLVKLAPALEAIHPGCQGKVSFEEACKVDDTLKLHHIPLDVIKERRQESTEAWLYVRILGKEAVWPFKPGSSELWTYTEFARKIKSDITKEEVEKAADWSIFVDTHMLADFVGEEAILTWENCD